MQASSELRALIATWFESVAKGDTSWLDRHISREGGVRFVGTDPGEWFEGGRVAEFFLNAVRALGGAAGVSYGEIVAFQEGNIGWGLANPVFTFPDGKRFSPRWSAVFHREDGEWKLVQLHASVGVSNQEALGMDING